MDICRQTPILRPMTVWSFNSGSKTVIVQARIRKLREKIDPDLSKNWSIGFAVMAKLSVRTADSW